MLIEWSILARGDLKEAVAYIQRDDPATAQIVAQKIINATQKLVDFPGLGRPGRVEGTRELIVSNLPYVLPYVVEKERVVILRVLHSAMDWPN
jgi:toxin ParE1/3/4